MSYIDCDSSDHHPIYWNVVIHILYYITPQYCLTAPTPPAIVFVFLCNTSAGLCLSFCFYLLVYYSYSKENNQLSAFILSHSVIVCAFPNTNTAPQSQCYYTLDYVLICLSDSQRPTTKHEAWRWSWCCRRRAPRCKPWLRTWRCPSRWRAASSPPARTHTQNLKLVASSSTDTDL